MRHFFIIIIITISFAKCIDVQNKKNENQNLLDNIYGTDTLSIKAWFADCGEWGGHEERFDIFRKNEDSLGIHYLKDTVNCSGPRYFNKSIVNEYYKNLDNKEQMAIIVFIEELICKSFNDEGISNAANSYFVTRKVGDLNIVYHNYRRNWNEFEKLKNNLAKP
jgi:hypothetical protein